MVAQCEELEMFVKLERSAQIEIGLFDFQKIFFLEPFYSGTEN